MTVLGIYISGAALQALLLLLGAKAGFADGLTFGKALAAIALWPFILSSALVKAIFIIRGLRK